MMNQDRYETSDHKSLFEAWIKSATEFWGSIAQIWSGYSEISGTPISSKKDTKGRAQESWLSALKMWQTLYSTLSEPGSMEVLFRGINTLPEIFLKMAETAWKGYFDLQKQWMERMGRIGQRPEPFKFENLDQDALNAWIEIYEKEFKQFLNIPQLGLTRFYQERMSQTMDKFNLFQAAMAEFTHLLYLPMEKSFKVMQERVDDLTKEGKLPESSQDYYRMWIKILEGHYMTLFKSNGYIRVLSNTLSAMENFMLARQELLNDGLRTLSIPTSKDMDELYKELYLLKKKVKELEKRKGRD
ncbi:MAG: poly(R)-hydroxyalkanoic acid synthase subunit PhaE [Thermodesulfobacteriota bacterium]